MKLQLDTDFHSTYSSEEETFLERMRSPSSLKQELLKKWLMGLQICRFSIKNTSVSERKNAIRLSADIAMASVRKGRTCWSRALLTKNASEDTFNKVVVHRILSSIQCEKLIDKKVSTMGWKTARHKKIVRRSKKILKSQCGRKRRTSVAAAVGKKLVKKRTQVLKSLVPGGEFMNSEVLLIQETLDYIVSLRAQVDIMSLLADAVNAKRNDK